MYLGRNNKILINLAFMDAEGWFGGRNRSLQLFEMLEDKYGHLKKIKIPTSPNRLITILYAVFFMFKYGYFRPLCLNSIQSIGYIYFTYSKLLSKYNSVDTLIIEGTGYGSIKMIDYFKDKDLKVILIPPNIESLAPYTDIWTHRIDIHKRYKQDVKLFKKVDIVYNISSEEAWLLQLYGVNSSFLPYKPPKELANIISKRKQNRKPEKDIGYLYVGNFNNEPNRLGLASLMNSISNNSFELDAPLRIIGRNSQLIQHLIPAQNQMINLVGEVTDEELELYYSKCLGVVIWHYPTSGMLTRVVELMDSNIPIYGNFAALKGYVHYSNNILVESQSEVLIS